MKVELLIARRMQLAGRTAESRRGRPGVVIAILGIALSVTVMTLTIAVMRGFKAEIRQKVTGFDSEYVLTSTGGAHPSTAGGALAADAYQGIKLTKELEGIVREVMPEAQIGRALVRPMMLKTDTAFEGLLVKAYDDTAFQGFIRKHLLEGRMPEGEGNVQEVVISSTTARRMELGVGDRVAAYFHVADGMKARRLTVTGIYDTGLGDYDRARAIASPGMLRSVDGIADDVAGSLEINGVKADEIQQRGDMLQERLMMAYYGGELPELIQVENIEQTGALYFNWLDMLDTNVVVILALMTIVACFTLVSSMFIIILERVRMIGLLKAIGAPTGMIRRVFMIVAERIVLRGLIAGNLPALLMVWLQGRYNIVPLDASTYYIDHVPVMLSVWDVVLLNIGVVAVTTLVLLLPTQIISRMSPATTLRYE